MNLTITQDNTRTETINSSIIDKLYEIAFAASSDPNSTVSLTGRLESPKGYKYKIDWLNTNFSPDLTITVPTSGLYILFHDPEVTNVLKTSIGDGEGISLSNIESVTSTSLLRLANNTSITDFREGCLFTGITNASTSFVSGCTNLDVLGIPPNITWFAAGMFSNSITKIIVKDWAHWTNIRDIQNNNNLHSGYLFYDMDANGDISLITHLVLPEGCNIPVDVNMDRCIIFKNSGLQEVTLPISMTYVGAFEGSSLKYLHFADGALPTQILSKAFSGCSSLEFNVSNLPTSITTLAYRCFYNCSKITGSVNLPNLTSILNESFRGSGITGTLSLQSLTTLGVSAFQECLGITKVECLGKISAIPEKCFVNYSGRSSNLQEIYIPYECTSIGPAAFLNNNSLTTIKQYTDSVDNWVEGLTPTVGNLTGVTEFGGYCFFNCPNLTLTTADIANAVSIGERAFLGCSSLTGTLNLPSLISLGNGAFQLTNITSVLNLGQISEIVDPFCNCPTITEIVLPTTLRKSSSFYNTHVSKLIYPYGFTEKISGLMCGDELGRYLLYILFPSTVTKIVCDDMYRDSGSSRIRCHIVVLATTPPNTNRNPSDISNLGLGWSWGDPSLANWYVPDAVVNTYKADAQWSSIANYIFPISQLETDSPTCWDWYQANKDYGVPNNN